MECAEFRQLRAELPSCTAAIVQSWSAHFADTALLWHLSPTWAWHGHEAYRFCKVCSDCKRLKNAGVVHRRKPQLHVQADKLSVFIALHTATARQR